MITIKSILASLSTVIVYLFGGFDVALQALIVFITLDYLTGLMKAYKSESLNSNAGFKGILKKVGMLILVAVGTVIDHLTGETGIVRSLVIYYLVANEGLSIIENLGQMDIIIPEFIKEKLEQLKEKE